MLAIAAKGMGKTVCAQTAAQELIRDGVCQRVLIVGPLKVCQLTWANEWKKWDYLEEPAMATGKPEARSAAVESDKRIIVINNENVKWLCDNYDLPEWGIDGLLIDESTKYKSSGSSKVKALRPRLKHFKWRAGLSASPMTETGISIYAQILLIDGGKALGRVQDLFRRKYFMQVDFQGYEWDWQPGGQQRLAEKLKDVIYMADDESYSASLPELREQQHFITLPEAARDAYTAMAEDMVAEINGDEIEAPTAAVMTQKLQQIAAGAMYLEDKSVTWIHAEKVEAVKRIVSDGGSYLIAYWFKFELDDAARGDPRPAGAER